MIAEINEKLSEKVFYVNGGKFTIVPGLVGGSLSTGRCYDLVFQNIDVCSYESAAGHMMGLELSGASMRCIYDWTAKIPFLKDQSGDLTAILEDTTYIDLDVVFLFPDPSSDGPDAVDVTRCDGEVDFDVEVCVDGVGCVFEDFGVISAFLDNAKDFVFDVVGGPLLSLMCDVFEGGNVPLLNDILIHNYPTLAKLAAAGSALFGEC